jgi:hypothetical protein
MMFVAAFLEGRFIARPLEWAGLVEPMLHLQLGVAW